MSSEVHKHIGERLIKKENLYNAKVLNFPKDKNLNSSTKLEIINDNFWNINDKSNEDQLRAVIGVCFMFGALILMGLYANLI